MSMMKVSGYFIESADPKLPKGGKNNIVTIEVPDHMILYILWEEDATTPPTKDVKGKGYLGTILFHPDEHKNIPYGFRITRSVGRAF